jgi:hypothetical protein
MRGREAGWLTGRKSEIGLLPGPEGSRIEGCLADR